MSGSRFPGSAGRAIIGDYTHAINASHRSPHALRTHTLHTISAERPRVRRCRGGARAGAAAIWRYTVYTHAHVHHRSCDPRTLSIDVAVIAAIIIAAVNVRRVHVG